MSTILRILAVLLALVALGWTGLRIPPKPFASFRADWLGPPESQPLPEGLPEPVARFYHVVYGEQVPVISSAVISGRARLRVMGITFPARFRFVHIAGQGYRHYIENTFYGLPILRVNEHYLDGKGRLELPFGVTEGEPKVDQAGNLGLWAESVWLPAVWLTDARARWESIDADSALLWVPLGEAEQTFVVRFDPRTGLVRYIESLRYRDAGDDLPILWVNEVLTWGDIGGYLLPIEATVTWFDQKLPWATFSAEDVVYNADVEVYIRATGP